MMGLARGALHRTEDIGFWKLCGSGTGEGFTPVPLPTVFAILATWPELRKAKAQTSSSPIFQHYQNRATESWTVFLAPISARGEWSGRRPFQVQIGNPSGPVAVLTRATVRPRATLAFWRRVPDISAVIGADANVLFKIGIGEVPLLHQVTFSIWPDLATMAAFARADGPHARAIRAVRREGWFCEELYARFQVLGDAGSWEGRKPLAPLETAA